MADASGWELREDCHVRRCFLRALKDFQREAKEGWRGLHGKKDLGRNLYLTCVGDLMVEQLWAESEFR